jgi:hypothetical protein
VKRAWILLLALAGCDRVEPQPYPASGTSSAAARAADAPPVREAMTAVLTAAQAVASTCVAGNLRYDLDPRDNYYQKYINPCIPERCEPKAAEVDALAESVKKARAVLDADPARDLASLRGLAALGDAMAGFARVAMAGKAAGPQRLSGLSMHHAALATAFGEVYPDAKPPVDPPSLTASLAVPDPGGDPCKAWQIPRFCDVAKVHVSSPLTWRATPPCIEVKTDPRTPSSQ